MILENCCFCCELKMGCIIIAILSIVENLISVISSAFYLTYSKLSDFQFHTFVFSLIMASIYIIAAVLMLWGTIKVTLLNYGFCLFFLYFNFFPIQQQRQFLLPWIMLACFKAIFYLPFLCIILIFATPIAMLNVPIIYFK